MRSFPVTLFRFRHLFLITVVFISLSCRSDDPSPGFGPNGEPRILSVTVPGAESVRIDQEAHQITVTLPTSFSTESVTILPSITPDTRFVKSTADSIRLWVFNDPKFSRIDLTTTGTTSTTNSYQVTFRQTGDLAFQPLTEPVSVTVDAFGSLVSFPIYNYIDGQNVTTLTFTHRQSGRKFEFPQTISTFNVPEGNGLKRTDGAVTVLAYFNGQRPYEPGDYTAEISKTNGRRAILLQPVQLVRGQPRAFFDANYPLIIGKPNAIHGANLFASDQLGLLFRSRNQPSQSIQSLGFLTPQNSFQITPPTQPGYYYTRLLLNNKPTDSYSRVIVVKNGELVIQNLSREFTGQVQPPLLNPADEFDVPITMSRGQTYVLDSNAFLFFPVGANGYKVPLPRFAVFTSLASPDVEYPVALAADGSAKFTLPTRVAAGRYRLGFRIVRSDQTIIEAIPLERDVLVQ